MFFARSNKKPVICSMLLLAGLTSSLSCLAQSTVSDNVLGELTPGPLLDQRTQLLKQIQQAKAEGVGTAGYMQAFQALESQVKTGSNEPTVQARMESIRRSLEEQSKKSKLLKTQRPLPPQGSQLRSEESGASHSASAAPAKAEEAATDKESAVIEKLKSKFGDRLEGLPEGMIPPQFRERLKDPATREKLLEKYKGSQ